MKRNNLYLGLVTPSSGWWSPIVLSGNCCIVEQAAWKKLSLLLKIQIRNTQILQLFTNIIKTVLFTKVLKIPTNDKTKLSN